MDIKDHMYFYYKDDTVYLTSVQPDGSVPSKRISVHTQRGRPKNKKYIPDNSHNAWKRFFIVPKKFFPYVSEEKNVVFELDATVQEPFSNAPAVLTMYLKDKEHDDHYERTGY